MVMLPESKETYTLMKRAADALGWRWRRLERIARAVVPRVIRQCRMPTSGGLEYGHQSHPDIGVIYPDDTFLVSFPRSGNTWIRFVMANLLYPDENWDHRNIEQAIPDIYKVSKEELSRFPRPRVLKSHELPELAYPRVVYIYRDGRDVAVSYYNHQVTTAEYGGDFEMFLREFCEGNVPFGSWHQHVEEWLAPAGSSNQLNVKYEDLCQSPEVLFGRIAAFLGVPCSRSAIREACRKSSFQSLRRSAILYSKHARTGFQMGVKGAPGAWKSIFSQTDLDMFWEHAGELMDRLGYERQAGEL